MKNIQMVDLNGQYNKIKNQIDTVVIQKIESTSFINGPTVKELAILLGLNSKIKLEEGLKSVIKDVKNNF